MPTHPRILVKPAPARFRYQQGWLGGWLVLEGQHVICATHQKDYAVAIASCLNIVFALFAHLPIKLAGVKTDAAN